MGSGLVNVNKQYECVPVFHHTQNSLSHLPVCLVQEQGEHFGDDGLKETRHEVVWNGRERGKHLR